MKKAQHVSNRIKVPRFPASRPSARVSMKAIRKPVLPYCQRKCGREVKTARSKLCGICFREQAVVSGARSSGNAIATGTLGNSGNATATGTLGNSGNGTKGQCKKLAGARSGLQRSSTLALVVKKHWLDLMERLGNPRGEDNSTWMDPPCRKQSDRQTHGPSAMG